MKTIVIVSLLLALISIILPVTMALSSPLLLLTGEPGTDGPVSEVPEPVADTPGEPALDAQHTISLSDGDSITEISMHDYLIGAVAAEMPASFEPEALRAQAVAIRTYVLHAENASPSSAHPDATVCSDSGCCLAWKPDDTFKEKWGQDYAVYLSKITAAVEDTDGLYISYSDSPALAAFHSSSAGQTEASSSVWSDALPYLVSVATPESSESVPNYVSSVTVSLSDFRDTILQSFPDAVFPDDTSKWLGAKVYTAGGRISSVTVGGVSVSGTKLRRLFSLRSTAMSIELSGSDIIITTTGYGHGVGMSQYGANVMASNGSSFEDILSWYYPGTELKSAEELL